MATKKTHVIGSRNVFEDLGHPRPAEALAKAELARKIGAIIEHRGLTQAAAAGILEVDQPKVSALIRGRLAGFSLDVAYPCIHRLRGRGYVREDARQYALSDQGHELVARLDAAHREGIQAYVDRLGSDEKRQLDAAFGITR